MTTTILLVVLIVLGLINIWIAFAKKADGNAAALKNELSGFGAEISRIDPLVRDEFGNFGVVLEKTKKKLQEATNVIDQAGVRMRVIERRLRDVQGLPQEQSIALLGEAENF